MSSVMSSSLIGNMLFNHLPEGNVEIRHNTMQPETVRVKAFAMARTPVPNSVFNDYIRRMGSMTHGYVFRRPDDGRPLVIARCEENGARAQVVNADYVGALLESGGAKLVRLVPRADRYDRLGARAVYFTDPNLPGTMVEMLEALGLADILSRDSGIDISIPTTTQWEYAAKGGRDLKYSPNGKLDPREVIYNHNRIARGPAPIEREGLVLNPFGLADMTGNVWEPTWFEGPVDKGDQFKIQMRGGAWDSSDLLEVTLGLDIPLFIEGMFAAQNSGARLMAHIG